MQQNRRFMLGALFTVVSGLIFGILGSQVADAQTQAVCPSLVTGTYLTTITDADGNVTSRSLLTLSADGTLSSVDSSQGGVDGIFNPFTSIQGAWQCTGSQTFAAILLNFTLAGSVGPDVGLARADYVATVNLETQELEGTIELRFFPLDGNPLVDEVAPIGPFSFVGQRLTVSTP